MTADGVVRGTLVGLSFGLAQAQGWKVFLKDDEYHATMRMSYDDLKDIPLGREFVLIPDDGTQVVVGREEWEAVRALVAKLDACDGAIGGAFMFQANHGIIYSGPTYYEELKRVRAIVTPEEHDHE